MPILNLPSVFTERRKRGFLERVWAGLQRCSWREFRRMHDPSLLDLGDLLQREFQETLQPNFLARAFRKESSQ